MFGKILFDIGKTVLGEAVTGAAENTLSNVVEKQKDPIVNAVTDAANDFIESVVAGTRTIDEWAEIAIKGVDKIRERKEIEEGLCYVDGRMFFEISRKNPKKVNISFQLYFQDSSDEWKRVDGCSDVMTSNFTDDAIDEMRSKGRIEFGVEG